MTFNDRALRARLPEKTRSGDLLLHVHVQFRTINPPSLTPHEFMTRIRNTGCVATNLFLAVMLSIWKMVVAVE